MKSKGELQKCTLRHPRACTNTPTYPAQMWHSHSMSMHAHQHHAHVHTHTHTGTLMQTSLHEVAHLVIMMSMCTTLALA